MQRHARNLTNVYIFDAEKVLEPSDPISFFCVAQFETGLNILTNRFKYFGS